MLNINRTSLKISDIDYILGKIVIFLIGMCVLITIISSIIGIVYRKKGMPDYEIMIIMKDIFIIIEKVKAKKIH